MNFYILHRDQHVIIPEISLVSLHTSPPFQEVTAAILTFNTMGKVFLVLELQLESYNVYTVVSGYFCFPQCL